MIEAEVILASVGLTGPPIYTLRVRDPRIIWAEVMTHRAFSRNARSSRAVPAKTMLEEIRNDPFVPWHWGTNVGGMQAGEETNKLVSCYPLIAGEVVYDEQPREAAWLLARDYAVVAAQGFADATYAKQIFNRLVEPFMWIDALITSVEWDNFFALRDHHMAEPHFRDLAVLMKEAISEAPVQVLHPGAWHLPYIQPDDLQRVWAHLKPEAVPAPGVMTQYLKKISAARCARISYAPFDGKGDIASELARYDTLMATPPQHASPVEHQATPDLGNRQSNLPDWQQFRKEIEHG